MGLGDIDKAADLLAPLPEKSFTDSQTTKEAACVLTKGCSRDKDMLDNSYDGDLVNDASDIMTKKKTIKKISVGLLQSLFKFWSR